MATEARLAAGLVVAALLRRCDLAAVPAYVLARGDETAGDILVKTLAPGGTATLWQRERDLATGSRAWAAVLGPAPESEVDAAIARRRRVDPDLWAVEIERDLPPEDFVPSTA